MPKFRIEKTLEATWLEVEARTVADAIMKARGLIPDKQFVTQSKAKRLDNAIK